MKGVGCGYSPKTRRRYASGDSTTNFVFSREGQQIRVPAHQGFSFPKMREIEERLILTIAAGDRTMARYRDNFAIRQIFGKQLALQIVRKMKFGIVEDHRQFGGGCSGNQRSACRPLPVRFHPDQLAAPKTERG
jgi:hypothetical protein